MIRSAFGVFYSQIFSNLGGIVLYPGFTVSQQFPDLGVGIAQPFRLSEGTPLVAVQNFDDPFFVERNASPSNPLNAGAQFGEINPMPHSLQWNFGIQRELARGTIFDISSVGTRGLNLPLSQSFNTIPFARGEELARIGSTIENQRARRLPNVTAWAPLHMPAHRATIHCRSKEFVNSPARWDFRPATHSPGPSTMAAASSRFPSRMVSTKASFQATSAISIAPSALSTGRSLLRRPAIPYKRQLADPQLDGQPHSHRSHGPPRYHQPDQPLSRSHATAPECDRDERQRQGAGHHARRHRCPLSALAGRPEFSVLAFRTVLHRIGGYPYHGAAGTVGNLGRNTTREPSEFNLDLAVARTFPIRERLRFEIRGEAFNFLNHTNFNAPNTT